MVSSKNGKEEVDASWSVRVRSAGGQEARAYVGKHSFTVGRQARFADQDPHPTGVEYFLGTLGADLVNGFQGQAAKMGIAVNSAECVVKGALDNPLVFLGVIGAKGRPGFGSISATLYVSAESDDQALRRAWESTLALSPILSTLQHGVKLALELLPSG